MTFGINKLKTNHMKNLIILALLLWIELNCFSQTKAVFPYNNPSKNVLRELAFTPNAKGFAFRTSLIGVINSGLTDTTFKVSATRLDEIFNHLYLEEVYLEERGYKNSGWDSVSKKMNPSIGHKWTGFAWVFRIGTFSIVVIKGDCGNILTVPVTRVEKIKQEIVYVNKDPKVIHDTVYVDNTEKVYVDGNNSNNNNQQRWSASSGTQNYTYWDCWNPPYPNYAPMSGPCNYNYNHYNGGNNCNNGYRGHRGNRCNSGYTGNSSHNYNYSHSNGNSMNNASYGTPSNYGYSNSNNNGYVQNCSWSTPTNYNYSHTNP